MPTLDNQEEEMEEEVAEMVMAYKNSTPASPSTMR